jgi:hypothetical protein
VSAAWDTPTAPIPAREVVEYLSRAVEAEIHAYCLRGGGRDFRHEDMQNAARDYLRALGVVRSSVADG